VGAELVVAVLALRSVHTQSARRLRVLMKHEQREPAGMLVYQMKKCNATRKPLLFSRDLVLI